MASWHGASNQKFLAALFFAEFTLMNSLSLTRFLHISTALAGATGLLAICTSCSAQTPATAPVKSAPVVGASEATQSQSMQTDISAQLPAGATLILDGADLSQYKGPGKSPDAKLEVVDAPDVAGGKAARLNVGVITDPIWDAQLASPFNTAPIQKGDVIFGSFDVRATSPRESGTGLFSAFLQATDQGWTGLRTISGSPGANWTRRFYSATAERDFPAGKVNLVFQAGGAVQQLDVANVRLYNLGAGADTDKLPKTVLTYVGREPDAPWRKKAAEQIDKYRKAALNVQVSDANGKAVEGADVHVELLKHKFQFGTFLDNDSPVLKQGKDADEFRNIVLNYFNTAMTPGYAASSWGWPDPNTRARYIKTIEWAKDHDMKVKNGHLVWSRFDFSPDPWKSLQNPTQLQNAVEAYNRDVLKELEPLGIDDLEVLNEPVGFHQFEDVIGNDDDRAKYFELAHEIAPSIPLLNINENGILSAGGDNKAKQDKYFAVIKKIKDAGAPLGGIGFQGHMGEDFTPPEQIWRVMDRFATFGVPLQVTEFDVSTEDEAVQADYVRDFTTAVFAHPSSNAVITWGFWEGKMWIPQAALWRKNWQPKPAGEAWMTLMKKTFNTDDTLKSDAQGAIKDRAFMGQVRVTATKDGVTTTKTVDLDKAGAQVKLVLGAG